MPLKTKNAACEQLGGQCTHLSPSGRRCSMAAAPGHESLCVTHWLARQREAEAAAAELINPYEEFRTAAAVNHALGKLFTQAARGRIPPRKAAVLAYIGQLLLHSVAAVQREEQLVSGYENWEAQLRRSVRRVDRAMLLADLHRANATDGPAEAEVISPEEAAQPNAANDAPDA